MKDPHIPKLRQMAVDMGLPMVHTITGTNYFWDDSGNPTPPPKEVPGMGIQTVMIEHPSLHNLLNNVLPSN